MRSSRQRRGGCRGRKWWAKSAEKRLILNWRTLLLLEEARHQRRATAGVLSERATTATVEVEPATGVGTAVSGWRSTGGGQACPSRLDSAPSARWEVPHRRCRWLL